VVHCGRPRSVRTPDNIKLVEGLALSQEDRLNHRHVDGLAYLWVKSAQSWRLVCNDVSDISSNVYL